MFFERERRCSSVFMLVGKPFPLLLRVSHVCVGSVCGSVISSNTQNCVFTNFVYLLITSQYMGGWRVYYYDVSDA